MSTENYTEEIYNLEVHEETRINYRLKVQRVPGGWIYKYFKNGSIHGTIELNKVIFVPFNNEFQETRREGNN